MEPVAEPGRPLDAVLPTLRVLGERPLFPAAVYFCLGIACVTALPASLPAGILLATVLLGLTVLLHTRKIDATLPLMALSLAVGYTLSCAALPAWAGDPWEPAGRVKVSGRIAEAWTTAGGYDGYILDGVAIGGKAVGGKAALTVKGASRGRLGDRLEALASLERPRPSLYHGGFNVRGWYMRRGVRFTGFAPGADITSAERRETLLALPERAREYARVVLHRYLSPDSAALVNALLSGDTSGIRQETKRDFTDLGLAHLLAVSGLNITLTAGAAWLLCRKLRIPMPVSLLMSFSVMAGYVLFAGLTPSVLRAAAMWIVAMGALLAARRYDPLSSLSAAAILILAVNPLDLFDAGFQLSFAATAAMLLWAVPVLRHAPEKRWMKGFAGGVGVTVAVTLFALPVILGYFNNVSLISPLANLVLVPASFVMQLAGTALLAVGFLPDAASLLGGILDGYASFYLQNVRLLSWSAATLPAATPPAWLALLYLALALFASPSVARYRPGGGGRAIVLALAAIAAAVMLTPASEALTWRSGAAAVAEGTSSLSLWWREGGSNYAACASGWPELSGYLESRGVARLDGLYLLGDAPPPENALQPSGGRVSVDRLYCPERWFSDAAAQPFFTRAAVLGMEAFPAEGGQFACVGEGNATALLVPNRGGMLAFIPEFPAGGLASLRESLAGADVWVIASKPGPGAAAPAGLPARAIVLPGTIDGAGVPLYNILEAGSVELERRGGEPFPVPWIGGWADGIQGNFR